MLSRLILLPVLMTGAMDTSGLLQVSLSPEQTLWVGERVFQNECPQKERCQIWWNAGEEFLSLGVGHFIWYPEGYDGPFDESFPKLLEHIERSGKALPPWLAVKPAPKCPWKDRDEFTRAADSERLRELRAFLDDTQHEQMTFLISRLNEALPLVLASAREEQRPALERKLRVLAASKAGIFTLVDYVNFKGFGLAPGERYAGKGWGLLQVLQEMPDVQDNQSALQEFVRAADKLLTDRVANAPEYRSEWQWLPGWRHRIHSYLRVE